MIEFSCEALLHSKQSGEFKPTAQPSAPGFYRVCFAPQAPEYSPLSTNNTDAAGGSGHKILLQIRLLTEMWSICI